MFVKERLQDFKLSQGIEMYFMFIIVTELTQLDILESFLYELRHIVQLRPSIMFKHPVFIPSRT